MGKFHNALGLGSFSGSKQQSNSRPPSACASPISTAPSAAAAASGPSVGPLTLGHQVAAKEQQYLPHMVADVVTEEADRIAAVPALASRQAPSSDNGKRAHDGLQPQAQLQYSNLAGKMLRMVNELRATGQHRWCLVGS